MAFTAWSLFADVGFLSVLLLAGQVLRANVPLFQRLRIPAAIFGGIRRAAWRSQTGPAWA